MACARIDLQLATTADAHEIASMSRDLVEYGLGWSWTTARVARSIRGVDTNALVGRVRQRIAGFAIMHFGMEEAHLNLLAVQPDCRRLGVGRKLIRWLEESALVAGISVVYLEVRASNQEAQAFYRQLGYQQAGRMSAYYARRETAIRMAHDLWFAPGAESI